MRRHALLSVPVLAVALATVPLAPAAVAAPPSDYSGDIQLLSFAFTGFENTGSVNHFTATSQTLLTGDLEGVVTNELSCVGYEEAYERSFTCHGTSTTVGTVDGEAFTTTSRVSFRCSYGEDRCTGRSITYEGTGAFAGTRGVTMFEQVATTGAGTWSLNAVGG